MANNDTGRRTAMSIRPIHQALALGALGIALQGGAALAADYATISLTTEVHASAADVWKKVGGFCQIKDWMKLTCVYTQGSGDLGTVRRLADRIDEVMVGKSQYSYTYTQPTTTELYHGTLEVVSEGWHKSRLNYYIVYDQAPLGTAEAKAMRREQRTKSFTTALQTMKKIAEGK
jgi:hypothetical protein